jgi:hypothetical protein
LPDAIYLLAQAISENNALLGEIVVQNAELIASLAGAADERDEDEETDLLGKRPSHL